RLAQYASYQENMASRLSHELRTPISVVRSSLHNLNLSPLPDEARVYMERAQQGLARLCDILTRMTEATRLEQSFGDDERQRTDASHLGLGLSIVRLIAEAHGGRAVAENREDGRGVVVTVTLPHAA